MKILLSGAIPPEIPAWFAARQGEPVLLPPYSRLDEPVASHPDMLVFSRLDGSLVVWGEYYRQNRALFDRLGCPILTEERKPSRHYPEDVALNALRMGEILLGRIDALSPAVLSDGKKILAVRQGYARCSTLVLNDSCAVTADPSIACTLEREGKTVLHIAPGGIGLPGYPYGFIGGASAVWGREVLFFGRLDGLPDGERIRKAVEKQGMSAIELGEHPLTDYGGAAFL